MGFALADSVSSAGGTNGSGAEAKPRLTWRTRQINSSKLRSRRVNANLLLSDEDHFGAIVPCSHSLSENKGARCSGRKFKRSLSPPVGLSPPAPLPSFSALPRTLSAIPSGTYISQHLGTYRQMGKPGLPTACFSGATLMDAYRDHHACVKI